MSNPGRWDRSFVKKLPKAQRLEVERLLVKGVSGKSITKKLGLPLNTWVSAVKKNPIPGGVLDPKGKMAKYEGSWIDLEGVEREYHGLGKDGKPKPGLPIIRKRGRRPNAQAQEAKDQVLTPERPVDKTAGGSTEVHDRSHTKEKLLPFSRGRARPISTQEAPGVATPSTPTDEGTGVPGAPVSLPDAKHEGQRSADEDDALYGDEGKKRGKGRTQGRIAKLAQKHYPLENRIKDLVALKDAALKSGETKVALDVIRTLNDMDGTMHAAKKDADQAPSNAPLFAMPKGVDGRVAVDVSPVGPVPMRLSDESVEDAVEESVSGDGTADTDQE